MKKLKTESVVDLSTVLSELRSSLQDEFLKMSENNSIYAQRFQMLSQMVRPKIIYNCYKIFRQSWN